jgi:hypothetical protein
MGDAVCLRRFCAQLAAALLAAGGVLLAGAVGSAAPANAAVNRYLAIAYSPATGQWGYSQSLLDANQAVDDAVGYCLNKGGTDCRIVVWGDNECAALATNPALSPTAFGTGIGPTQEEAERKADLSVPLGHTVLSFCSLGTEH